MQSPTFSPLLPLLPPSSSPAPQEHHLTPPTQLMSQQQAVARTTIPIFQDKKQLTVSQRLHLREMEEKQDDQPFWKLFVDHSPTPDRTQSNRQEKDSSTEDEPSSDDDLAEELKNSSALYQEPMRQYAIAQHFKHLAAINPSKKLTVSQRLEKNRQYALAQQLDEERSRDPLKSFYCLPGNIPSIFSTRDYDNQKDIMVPMTSESALVDNRVVAIASCIGSRMSMEDEHLAVDFSFLFQGQEIKGSLFGVFDGHCGPDAALFVKTNLVSYLTLAFETSQHASLEDVIFHGFKDCFKNLDADFIGKDGTTANVCLILNETIWIANTGDSRAVLVSEKKILQASEDAKPEIERYKTKIEKAGGYVVQDETGLPRANGYLSLARAIGDHDPILMVNEVNCISANPKITSYPLADFEGGYLIQACDGLFDVAPTTRFGNSILKLHKKHESVIDMTKRTVFSAITCGSADNVTVLIVKL